MSNKKLSAAEWFAEFTKKLEQDGRLQIDAAKLELSEQIFKAMEANQVSEAELSRRLGVSRAYVNKILQGDTNFTIETLVKIGIALGAEFKFEFVPETRKEEPKNVEIEDDFSGADIVYVEKEWKTEAIPVSASRGFKSNMFYGEPRAKKADVSPGRAVKAKSTTAKVGRKKS
jgi:transcriptional regulator with XRE-family HTH domain